MENAMLGSKTVGRVVFFSLGYLAGTRAGRERAPRSRPWRAVEARAMRRVRGGRGWVDLGLW